MKLLLIGKMVIGLPDPPWPLVWDGGVHLDGKTAGDLGMKPGYNKDLNGLHYHRVHSAKHPSSPGEMISVIKRYLVILGPEE